MILITMAGLSSRFSRCGYTAPKFALKVSGKTVFDWAIGSFERYFDSEFFLFVVRSDGFAKKFVNTSVRQLGISDYAIVELKNDTRGQAETAYLALSSHSIDFPVTVFNIDTIRHDYRVPDFIDACDGYLEVFEGEGAHWSFVEPGPNGSVLRTTEKERISNLCSDGLYYFKSQLQFRSAFEDAMKENDQAKGEFYIAPLYNRLIRAGLTIKYEVIGLDQIDFCGTPEEYEALCSKKDRQ